MLDYSLIPPGQYFRLTEDAEIDYEMWGEVYGGGNCSCHLNPPCGCCTHPGNPRNLNEDDAAWEYEHPLVSAVRAVVDSALAQ